MRGAGFGRLIDSISSPLSRQVCPGPVGTFSTATERRPLGPTMTALAPAAIIAGTLSAAGEALHRLPASVQRPWIWSEPIRFAASTTPGQALVSALCSPNRAPGTPAPMLKPRAVAWISLALAMCLMSTTRSGSTMPIFSFTSKSVPPASKNAWPFSLANNPAASFAVSGLSYLIVDASPLAFVKIAWT